LIRHYRLSRRADVDIVGIFEYTIEHFGLAQAENYLTSMDEAFGFLAANPNAGKDYMEVRKGVKGFVHAKHIIFYSIEIDHVFILRVLHHSRDLKRHL
jgi:toxin ParE1/3/4